jgi:hypothetical protein
MRCHVPYITGPCLPVEVGSGAITCLLVPDLASLIGRASAPPRVLWLLTLPPYKGGLRCATCPTALDSASL